MNLVTYKVPATLLLASILVACATPYKEYGSLGGYTDQKLGTNRYLLKFVGNGFTSREIVQQHWNRRASELCNGKPYKSETRTGTEIRRAVVVSAAGAYNDSSNFPVLEGTVECQS